MTNTIRVQRWAAAILYKAGYWILAKYANMPIANPYRTGKPGAVKKISGAFFFSVIIQHSAGGLSQGFSAGMHVHQYTRLLRLQRLSSCCRCFQDQPHNAIL